MVFRKIGEELGLGAKRDDDEDRPSENAAPPASEAPTITPPGERRNAVEAPAVVTEPSLIDPSWSVADPVVETVVGEAAADPVVEAVPVPEGPVPEAAAAVKTYTVQPGDTLSAIAQRFYGDANAYTRIFDANRDKLDDPNLIQPGQELSIPS